MCTVFAESEVISLITKGISREEIAIAIHKAIAKRVVSIPQYHNLAGALGAAIYAKQYDGG